MRIIHGDMREVLGKMIAEGKVVQSVVTDPPYHLTTGKKGGTGLASLNVNSPAGRARISTGFMGKAWDGGDIAFQPGTWRLCWELLPPGGHLVAFSGTRTYHRMAVAIEEAGFEIRDTIAWLYGSGFPKSKNVSKAIDQHAGRMGSCIIALKQRLIEMADASGKTRAAIDAECGFRATNYLTLPAEGKRPDPWVNCLPPADKWQRMKAALGCGNDLDATFQAAEREIVGQRAVHAGLAFTSEGPTELDITAPATDAARQWEGWGTALKPAAECVCVAQKPYGNRQLIDMIGSTLKRLEHQLWSLLSANVAAEIFGLSPSEHDGACASAPWSAVERSNTQAALCARMDTSRCVLATLSSLSTVRSWHDCLADASTDASTSTTETVSSTTIDPKIWKSCLSKITPASIILAHRSGAWSSADADTAARLLNADALRLNAIRERSAVANASDLDATLSQDAGELKPNLDLICVARKPLDGTVAGTVLRHGTGALNIDSCRVPHGDDVDLEAVQRQQDGTDNGFRFAKSKLGKDVPMYKPTGRWPANVCHDGSDEVVRAFPDRDSCNSPSSAKPEGAILGGARSQGAIYPGQTGSAARFFYSAKADADDRLGSKHPTVKPVDLMRWLVRLITPPGGTVLDPFAGSGATGMACMAEGIDCILVEREAEYVADIKARLAHVRGDDTPLFRAAD